MLHPRTRKWNCAIGAPAGWHARTRLVEVVAWHVLLHAHSPDPSAPAPRGLGHEATVHALAGPGLVDEPIRELRTALATAVEHERDAVVAGDLAVLAGRLRRREPHPEHRVRM